jgi:hypothetical protein
VIFLQTIHTRRKLVEVLPKYPSFMLQCATVQNSGKVSYSNMDAEQK